MAAVVHRAALTLLLGLAVACSSSATPAGAASHADLVKEPAVELVYPGATRGGGFGGDWSRTLTAENPAWAGYAFTTTDDPKAVVAYYDTELTRLGWLHTRPPILASNELHYATTGWCKPGMYFRLAFRDPEGIPPPRTYSAMTVATRQPCPDPLGSPRVTAPTAPPRSP